MATTPTPPQVRYAREYLIDQPGVYVPAWVAAWLEANTDLSQRRMRVRGANRAVDEALLALRHAAMSYRATGSDGGSDSGTKDALDTAGAASSSQRLNATAAADLLGISSRAIRKAIATGRLPAERAGRFWLIDPDDLDRYHAARAA